MKAMILAAGLGTRLKPLTEKTPKSLILVNNKPLILYSLLLLKKYGITEVLVNLHHLGSLIEKEFGDGRRIGMKISYSWEDEILGTGGGIKKGEAFFEGSPFIALNSDILIDANLKKFWAFHRKKCAAASMALAHREPGSEYSWIRLGRGERIVEIAGNGPPAGGPPTEGVSTTRPEPDEPTFFYTGLQILEPKLLSYLPAAARSCIINDGYRPAIIAKEKIAGWVYDGYWNDLGTMDRYRQADSDLSSGRVKLSYFA